MGRNVNSVISYTVAGTYFLS